MILPMLCLYPTLLGLRLVLLLLGLGLVLLVLLLVVLVLVLLVVLLVLLFHGLLVDHQVTQMHQALVRNFVIVTLHVLPL